MKQKNNKDVENDFENWHKPEYEEDPDNVPQTFKHPPKRFEKNFLSKMDGRTEIFQQLKTAYDELTSDLGSAENLSHVKLCLCERFIWLEFVLQQLEMKMATNPKESGELISKWIQACNSIVGIGKTLGLERKARQITNLKDYIKERE
jgi:hypothetical protein